jgi:hypothetical protein
LSAEPPMQACRRVEQIDNGPALQPDQAWEED